MIRTHNAGTLRAEHVGHEVVLAGWVARRRDHGGVAFIDLRDASGVVQVVVRDADVAHDLRNEYLRADRRRGAAAPGGNENPDLPTGDVEVVATDVEVLSEAAPLPFQIDDQIDVGEEARLRWRYLDLRRSGPARALRMRSRGEPDRSRLLHDARLRRDRDADAHRVDARRAPATSWCRRACSPGSWYALPQSPQLFKQLLMVAGMERYYQIARCYRDEDFRADRQPEFTQLDIEMSFVEQDDVIALGEEIVRALWKGIARRPTRRRSRASPTPTR